MINLCKFGQNPSIHSGVQTRGYTDAKKDTDVDRIHTKKQYVLPLLQGDIILSVLTVIIIFSFSNCLIYEIIKLLSDTVVIATLRVNIPKQW